MTALMLAAAGGHAEAVRAIIEIGAEVDKRDSTTGATALIKVDSNVKIFSYSDRGRYPSVQASQIRSIPIVRLLLESGADVKAEV